MVKTSFKIRMEYISDDHGDKFIDVIFNHFRAHCKTHNIDFIDMSCDVYAELGGWSICYFTVDTKDFADFSGINIGPLEKWDE